PSGGRMVRGRWSLVAVVEWPVRGGRAAPSEQPADRGGGAAPVLLPHPPTSRLDEGAPGEGGDDRGGERAEERDELRDEVDGRRDPGDADEKQGFGAPRHSGVAQEVFEQQRQVRQEGGHLTRRGSPPGEQQPHDEQYVEDGDDGEGDQKGSQ